MRIRNRVFRGRVAKLMIIVLVFSLIDMTSPTSGVMAGKASMVSTTGDRPKVKIYRCEHISQETFIGDEDIDDVILMDSVQEVDDDAFLQLDNLRRIVVWGTGKYFSYFNCLYTMEREELVYVPPHVEEIAFHHKLMWIRPHACLW